MTCRALTVSRVLITTGRMTCHVDVAPGVPKYATPLLMEQVLRRYPMLPHHACVNGVGPTFGCVMNETSLPHILEHLIIDIQVRAGVPSRKPLLGTTEWANEKLGAAVVSVSFCDDLCALAALNEAIDFLNELLIEQVQHL